MAEVGTIRAQSWCNRVVDPQEPGLYDGFISVSPAKPTDLRPDDRRLTEPLFTLRETAVYLQLPRATLNTWASSTNGQPLVKRIERGRLEASVPFIGFAEAYVLRAIRKSGVPMQRIRPAVEQLQAKLGLGHALTSRRLFTDGAEVIYDYAKRAGDREYAVVRNGQQPFPEIIEGYLKRITYGDDGWASSIQLPAYREGAVIVDPTRAFGLPLLADRDVRVEDIVGRFRAGDSAEEIGADFDVSRSEVEDVIRVALALAA